MNLILFFYIFTFKINLHCKIRIFKASSLGPQTPFRGRVLSAAAPGGTGRKAREIRIQMQRRGSMTPPPCLTGQVTNKRRRAQHSNFLQCLSWSLALVGVTRLEHVNSKKYMFTVKPIKRCSQADQFIYKRGKTLPNKLLNILTLLLWLQKSNGITYRQHL